MDYKLKEKEIFIPKMGDEPFNTYHRFLAVFGVGLGLWCVATSFWILYEFNTDPEVVGTSFGIFTMVFVVISQIFVFNYLTLKCLKDLREPLDIVLTPNSLKYVNADKVVREVPNSDLVSVDFKYKVGRFYFSNRWERIVVTLKGGHQLKFNGETSRLEPLVRRLYEIVGKTFTPDEEAYLLLRGDMSPESLINRDGKDYWTLKKEWHRKLKRENLVPPHLIPYVRKIIENWDKL